LFRPRIWILRLVSTQFCVWQGIFRILWSEIWLQIKTCWC
jgi:hypothetical protein